MSGVHSHPVKSLLAALALALPAAAAAETPGEGPAPAERPAAPVGGEAPAGAAPAADAAAPAPGAAPAPAVDGLPEARPHAFSSRVEPDRVELGRPFRLVIEVRHDPAERYALAGEPALGGLTARAAPAVERTEENGVATTRIVLSLAAFDALGDRELPEQTLIAEGPAGKARLAVPGPPLHVVATSEGEELANPPPQPLILVAWDRIALVAGIALALALAAWALWRRRKRRPAAAAAPVELDRRTPEERALAALDALEAEGGLAARERYFRLSASVRGFLAEVTDLPAVDLTTEELVEALARSPVPGLATPAFRGWLARGDLVRFARAEPEPGTIVADVAEARAFVREIAAARRAEEERRRAEAEAAAARGEGPGDPPPPAPDAPAAPRAGEGGR